MSKRERLHMLTQHLAGKRLLIVGDVILDEYLTGTASRLSREAPIPVLEFESRRYVAGGAANPAANIAALGSTPLLVGVIGADSEGQALAEVLRTGGIAADALVIDPERPTTTKTRIMAHMGLRFPQQMARMDRLSRAPLSATVAAAVLAQVAAYAGQCDAILVSDYLTGLLTPPLVEFIRAQAGRVLTTADAQGQFDKYAGFDVIKCNADEARAYLRREVVTDADFADAAQTLHRLLGIRQAVVITRGGDGATVATGHGVAHCPAPVITDVYDTVGAGDTAIAVITLALVSGATPEEAVMLANTASGIVVRRVGNYAPSSAELAAAVDDADE